MHWYTVAGDAIIWLAGVYFGARGLGEWRRFGRRVRRRSLRPRADWRGRRIV